MQASTAHGVTWVELYFQNYVGQTGSQLKQCLVWNHTQQRQWLHLPRLPWAKRQVVNLVKPFKNEQDIFKSQLFLLIFWIWKKQILIFEQPNNKNTFRRGCWSSRRRWWSCCTRRDSRQQRSHNPRRQHRSEPWMGRRSMGHQSHPT